MENNNVYQVMENLSSCLDYNVHETAIILAAGHGKRIKSATSKMLHKIWEVPTVERVYNASRAGIPGINTIIVVGIKAENVMEVLGKKDGNVYAYQEQQNGTGHAVQVALDKIDKKKFSGIVYVLPGDMGLIDKETMQMFREEFLKSKSDMMVLTGIYEGSPNENAYGRIIRVKDADVNGKPSGDDAGKVIEIMEHKDILKLSADAPYKVTFNGKVYSYTRQELIENNEFNSGVYAFGYKQLTELVDKLSNNNAQNEIYITDLISLFNQRGYSVTAVSPKEQHVVMGFNNKSVLMEMEAVARKKNFDLLKDIVEIADPDDFFVDETVIEEILAMDKLGTPLDIKIGKGAYIGKGVKVNYNLELKVNAVVYSNVHFGKNVTLWNSVQMFCMPDQSVKVGDNVEILRGDTIKGNVEIGSNTRIESSVNITGSDEHPVKIGSNVVIKGKSYIYGSVIEDDLLIEQSVLVKKYIKRLVDAKGSVQPIRYYTPQPEGLNAIKDL